MVKKVQAAHFSQAGQAAAVLASIVAPLPLRGDESFDLIVLAYPVWFLSPPPPVTAFLRHPTGRALLRDKPVVTVTACRNMWVMAQQTVKLLLSEAGARHIDQVVLTDRSHPLATFITAPRRLLTGRRDALRRLPPAGVSEQQIRAARCFGLALRDGLRRDDEKRGAPMLSGLRACEVDPRLVASEKIGIRSFCLWGSALRALGPPGAPARRALLAVHLVFPILMIVIVVPLKSGKARIKRVLLSDQRECRCRRARQRSALGL